MPSLKHHPLSAVTAYLTHSEPHSMSEDHLLHTQLEDALRSLNINTV